MDETNNVATDHTLLPPIHSPFAHTQIGGGGKGKTMLTVSICHHLNSLAYMATC